MNTCLNCKTKNLIRILDFGKIPISNNFVKENQISNIKKYKLGLNFCKKCYLIQNSKLINNKKIFNKDYLYHSSYSKSWLQHAKNLSDYCIKKYKLNQNSLILEIASNDGYLLKNFNKRNINTIGVEPSRSVAIIAKKKGIKTYVDFFSTVFVKKILKKIVPDIIIALNVMAHTPKLNDFINALSMMMNKSNISIIEVPYALNLLKKKQIDTVYHEHYSYFSVIALQNLLTNYSLEIFDIKPIKTHGGSLRIFVKKNNNLNYKKSYSITKFLRNEKKLGLQNLSYYKNFSKEVKNILRDNRKKIQRLCKKYNVLGYGAAAKATIICNLLNLNARHIRFIIDQNKFKQFRYIPGTNIQISKYNIIKKINPNYILIFVWNIKKEIKALIRKNFKKIRFITFEPKLKISN